jgi:hypothetical protein
MVHHTCKVCGASFDSPRAQRDYCSGRCRTALYRANKAAVAAGQQPRYDALQAGLQTYLPASGLKAKALRAKAGEDCTESIFELVATILREIKTKEALRMK